MEIAEAMRSRWVMVYPARFVELSVAELMRACRITSFALSCQPPTLSSARLHVSALVICNDWLL